MCTLAAAQQVRTWRPQWHCTIWQVPSGPRTSFGTPCCTPHPATSSPPVTLSLPCCITAIQSPVPTAVSCLLSFVLLASDAKACLAQEHQRQPEALLQAPARHGFSATLSAQHMASAVHSLLQAAGIFTATSRHYKQDSSGASDLQASSGAGSSCLPHPSRCDMNTSCQCGCLPAWHLSLFL